MACVRSAVQICPSIQGLCVCTLDGALHLNAVDGLLKRECRVKDAVAALAGSGIPVASVATGFPSVCDLLLMICSS